MEDRQSILPLPILFVFFVSFVFFVFKPKAESTSES